MIQATQCTWDDVGPELTGPLKGLRVIDFTIAWAGPMTTRSLAYLGAAVIKVEAPGRPDPWRAGYLDATPERFPGFDPGLRPYNRNVFFNTQSHDKWSLSLDLKAKGGVEVAQRLARDADVIIANFSPGVLDRLGVGYDALSAVNPKVIVVEMPAFGVGGPMAGHVAMGKSMEAANGMASLIGYGDGRPVLTGSAYLDPIGGLNATVAVLMALHQRGRTGEGTRVEVAQTESAAHWIGEYLLEELYRGVGDLPDGNHVPNAAPHDAYPCKGDDEWIAIAVRSEDEWHGLCAVMGRGDLARDARYASVASRLRFNAELDGQIAAWTSMQDKEDAAVALQDAGVPAAPVNNGRDISGDPALRAAGFVARLDHPDAGPHEYPALPYHLERTRGSMRRAAPLFGEHNLQVLAGILGLAESEIAALYESGAVTDEPWPGTW